MKVLARVVLSLWFAVSAQAAENTKPIRLAAPGFTGVNVDDKVANFFSEHFAQKLSLQGISVMSSSEVAALVGLERQKQLMGCGEDSSSCLAELANALGADGVITGSIGKFGSTYQLNLKILSATNASALSIISKKAFSEEDLLEVLDDAAVTAAGDLREKLGRTGTAAPPPREERASRSEPGRESGSSASSGTAAPSAMNAKLNNFTFWTVGPVLGVYAVEYERAVTPNVSLFFQPSLTANNFSLGAEAALGGRFFLFGTAPEGLFVGAELKANAGSYLGDLAAGLGVSGSAGFTFRLFNLVAVSMGGGVGGYFARYNVPLHGGWLDLFLRLHAGVAF